MREHAAAGRAAAGHPAAAERGFQDGHRRGLPLLHPVRVSGLAVLHVLRFAGDGGQVGSCLDNLLSHLVCCCYSLCSRMSGQWRSVENSWQTSIC